MSNKYQINLIKKPDMTLTDRVFYFVFHYFRYILVLTQICVVGVFFYRFTVDQGIIDTKEAINQKVAMLKVVGGIVNEATMLEGRIELVSEKLNRQKYSASLLQSTLANTSESSLKSIDLDSNLMKLSLLLPSVDLIQIWEDELKKSNPFIKSIKTDSVQRLANGEYEINFQIAY